MMHRISLIVATKDRPDDLRTLFHSLRGQTAPPHEIVVVDSSIEPVEPVTLEFPDLNIRYLKHWPPSAAAQRNAGIAACDSEATLIGFADDDTTFEPNAFAVMLDFWRHAEPDILGAAFNIRNYPQRAKSPLKHSFLAEKLGLYSSTPGEVSRSGWQTVINELPETRDVKWLPSTASIFRRTVPNSITFDEFFETYSYLEDLDFSVSVGRAGRLAVVAEAGFFHLPSAAGRVSARQFGRFEIRNRLYFVRKHQLSLSRCYLGLLIRMTQSILGGMRSLDLTLWDRALGNAAELVITLASPTGEVVGRSTAI